MWTTLLISVTPHLLPARWLASNVFISSADGEAGGCDFEERDEADRFREGGGMNKRLLVVTNTQPAAVSAAVSFKEEKQRFSRLLPSM